MFVPLLTISIFCFILLSVFGNTYSGLSLEYLSPIFIQRPLVKIRSSTLLLEHRSSFYLYFTTYSQIHIMRSPNSFCGFLVATCLIDSVLSRPYPQGGYSLPINNDDVPGIPIGPPGAIGSVYGSAAFLGRDGNPINPADTAIVSDSDYTMVPGQEADPNLGFYLDLSDSPNPQPIRGPNGATDPGSSKFISFYLDKAILTSNFRKHRHRPAK